MDLRFADVGFPYILAACVGALVIAGPPFMLGLAGRHTAALAGILVPGAIVFVALASYLGHPLAHAGLIIALAAAGAAVLGWLLGAALWQLRRSKDPQRDG